MRALKLNIYHVTNYNYFCSITPVWDARQNSEDINSGRIKYRPDDSERKVRLCVLNIYHVTFYHNTINGSKDFY